MNDWEETNSQDLSLYIAYEDFIGSGQLSEMLLSLDRLYSILYVATNPEASLPLSLETRLRVKESRTGESIQLVLADGIQQIWDTAGPTLQITSTMGIAALSARLIIGFAKGVAEFRKTWHEGSKAKYEAQKTKHEVKGLQTETEKDQTVETPSHAQVNLSDVPSSAREQASAAALQFLNIVEYAPNIIVVRVNDTTIVDKRANESNSVG